MVIAIAATVFLATQMSPISLDVTALSGNIDDIQASINQVASQGGGTVYVPSGVSSDSYSSSHRLNLPGGVNLVGGSVSGSAGQGSGVWSTTLVMNAPASDGTVMLTVDGSNGKKSSIRNIYFKGYRESSAPFVGYTGLSIKDMVDFVVYGCRFSDFGYGGISVSGVSSQGVVSHCEFWNMTKGTTYSNMIHIGYGLGIIKTYTISSVPWPSLDNILGKYNGNTYIEDSYFYGCRHSIVAFAGGSYVARHDVFTMMWNPGGYDCGHVDVHGAYTDSLGGRSFEAYDNVFYNPPNTNFPNYYQHCKPARIRGGGGVFYHNTIYDVMGAFQFSTDDGNNLYPQCKPKDVWIWDNTLNNVGSLIDPYNDYPAVEGSDYYLYAKSGYSAYVYPHPLVSGIPAPSPSPTPSSGGGGGSTVPSSSPSPTAQPSSSPPSGGSGGEESSGRIPVISDILDFFGWILEQLGRLFNGE